MIVTGLVGPLLVALVAVLPGAFVLLRGHRLARFADDPALPELLFANRRPNSVVLGVCFGILIMTAGGHYVWALPLLIVTRMAAGYPLRKTLHRETWTLGGYLSFFLRLIVAAFGSWTLLAVTPGLVAIIGSHEWIVAGSLAAVLFAWNGAYSTVFSAVLRARPVDDPVLLARFAQMLKECSLPEVALKQVDLRGGMFANAVALPSTRRPMVVVSSTLVERMDHEEVTAILAHELAHIEYYNPRRLRQMGGVTHALVVAGVLLAPVVQLTAPQALTAMLILWPAVLVTVMVLRAKDRQKHETASDLRALALAGDPEALIRALTKLHAFARLPRRWDTELERHATHPSLARRIQAIRAAAGTSPAALGEAATFAGVDGSSSVTFHDDRLQWSEGASATHTMAYGHVTMLRVDAGRSGSPRLVAVDRANRRWEIVLRPSDVSRAQATLDIVDGRLAAAAGPPVLSLALSRALTIMTLLAAVTTGQFLVGLLGLIAVLLPAPAVTAAMGAASVGTVMLIWRDQPAWMTETQRWTSIALMLCGLGMIAVSIANRREKASRPALVSAFAGFLAIGTGFVWGAIAFYGTDAVDLHYAALEWPSAAVLPVALAAALAFARWRPVRYASVLFATAGFVAVALGSTTFLHRFAPDPSNAAGRSQSDADDLTPRPADAVLSEGVPKEIPHADLYFVAIGDVPADLMSDMTSHFEEKFGMRITVLPALSFDRVTFDPVRSQTVADELIAAVRQRYRKLASDGRTRVIGVTPYDMYMQAMGKQGQFTFSLRSDDEHFAVVSYARMDPSSLGERPDPGRFTARLHKMVAKNIGIMYYGLPISQDPRSVLYGQIGGVDELDLMTEYFEPR